MRELRGGDKLDVMGMIGGGGSGVEVGGGGREGGGEEGR